MDTVKLSTILAVGIMLVGVFIFEIFPEQLLKLFNASEQMLQIGVPALRIISLSFVFAGVSITVVSVFQALGNGIYSLIISIVRQLSRRCGLWLGRGDVRILSGRLRSPL